MLPACTSPGRHVVASAMSTSLLQEASVKPMRPSAWSWMHFPNHLFQEESLSYKQVSLIKSRISHNAVRQTGRSMEHLIEHMSRCIPGPFFSPEAQLARQDTMKPLALAQASASSPSLSVALNQPRAKDQDLKKHVTGLCMSITQKKSSKFPPLCCGT